MTRRLSLLLFILTSFVAIPLVFAENKAKTVIYEFYSASWSVSKGNWSSDKLSKKITEIYNADGTIASEERADGRGVVVEKTVYSYEGDTIRKTTTDAQNKLRRTTVVTRKQNVFTEKVAGADGVIMFIQVMKKNADGVLEEMEYRDAEDKLVYRCVYLYNKKGNLEIVQFFNPDESFAVQVYYDYAKFDANGVWLMRTDFYTYGDVWGRPHETVIRTFN